MNISGQDLVQSLATTGGELRIADPAPRERAAWRRAIFQAIDAHLLPPATCLRFQGRAKGDMVIRLLPAAEGQLPDAPPRIPVPGTLRRLHPVLAATRERHQGRRTGEWCENRRTPNVLHLRITQPQLARALRIVQGIVDEAARRGYGVKAMPTPGCKVGGMAVVINGHPIEIYVKEASTRIEHVMTATEQRDKQRYSYSYVPRWDYVPSSRLELHAGHPGYRSPLASDRDRLALEDRLGRVFLRLEAIAQEAEDRRLAEEERHLAAIREAERRREAWKLAMHVAGERYVEHTKAKALLDQIDRRQKAATIREFLTLTSEKVESAEEKQWLEWAADYADAIDPFLRPLAAPEVAEPTAEDLVPFLDGWSPYGPEDVVYRR